MFNQELKRKYAELHKAAEAYLTEELHSSGRYNFYTCNDSVAERLNTLTNLMRTAREEKYRMERLEIDVRRIICEEVAKNRRDRDNFYGNRTIFNYAIPEKGPEPGPAAPECFCKKTEPAPTEKKPFDPTGTIPGGK